MSCKYAPEPPAVVYLNSKQSIEYFPDNTGGNFSNYLPTPISIEPESYEVALTEIFYTPKKQVLRYFKNENDNYIKVHKDGRIYKELAVTKDSEDINDWLLSANIDLDTNQFEVEILEEVSAHGTHIILKNKNENKILKMSLPLATALGFSTTIFEKGEHKSPNPVDAAKFESLDAEIKLSLETENDTKVVRVPEPSEYTFAALQEEISKALQAESTGVTISVATSGTTISSIDDQVGIEFSARLAKTFGLPFTVHTDNNEYTQPSVISWEPLPSMLCVSSDITLPTCFGSKTTSWLRILQQSTDYGRTQHTTFNSPSFHTVTKSFFQTIHIQITDEHDRQFDFGDEGVTLSLQFREKQ